MRTFSEFVQEKSFDSIKIMVFNILDPDHNLDWESSSVLTQPLSDFKTKEKLLSSPGLRDMINDHDNKGAILQAIQNDTTTIGNLLALMGGE